MQGESNSIQNQKKLLEDYAKAQNFFNTKVYIDDGYSGVSFDRPDFKKMITDMESGLIERIIVKDLSRFGRNHLRVGIYIEEIFSKYNVQFIAIEDSVNTFLEDNEMMFFKNYFNEFYAKDTSRKIRAVTRMRAEQGERIATRAPYGYKKNESDTKKIVPDEESAKIADKIFTLCAGGMGPTQIAKWLQKEKIYNPTVYAYYKYGSTYKGYDTAEPYKWSSHTVSCILENQAYIGHTVNLKSTTRSYNDKTVIVQPEEDWLVFENTHEPLISLDIWDMVQSVRKNKRRRNDMDEQNQFSGLVYCADCHATMVLHRASTIKKSQYHFACRTYKSKGRGVCSAHFIREEQLEQVILSDLREVLKFARDKAAEFAKIINENSSQESKKEIKSLQKELLKSQKREQELTTLFTRLYEDNVLGRVNDEQFQMLSSNYNGEQQNLKEKIPQLEGRILEMESSLVNVDRFLEKAKTYTDIKELTPEILRLFIDKIVIHEKTEKYSRTAPQKIEIYYAHIGVL